MREQVFAAIMHMPWAARLLACAGHRESIRTMAKTDDEALLSPLQKNQELKTAMLE